jgi:hypothetical protein
MPILAAMRWLAHHNLWNANLVIFKLLRKPRRVTAVLREPIRVQQVQPNVHLVHPVCTTHKQGWLFVKSVDLENTLNSLKAPHNVWILILGTTNL